MTREKSFEDTPVGRGAQRGRLYASYTNADLAAIAAGQEAGAEREPAPEATMEERPAHGLATAVPRSAADRFQSRPPSPAHSNSTVEIVRPFAAGQEDFVAALNGLRKSITETLLREYDTNHKIIPAAWALGAVIMSGGVFGAARKSADVRALTKGQIVTLIQSGQPATYTGQLVVDKIQPYFYGGTPTRRTNMGLLLPTGSIRAEGHSAIRTLQVLAGEQAKLSMTNPFIPLFSASTFIPAEAKAGIQNQVIEAIGHTPTIVLEPSPLLVSPS